MIIIPGVLSYTEGQPYPDFNASSPTQLVRYTNSVTENWMGLLVMMVTTIVTFALLRKKNNRLSDSLALAFLLNLLITGTFLWALGLITGNYLVFWLVCVILSVLYSFVDSS